MSTSHDLAFSAWTDNTAGARKEPESFVQFHLTKAYPDHHVTRTHASKCDVIGFAEAGFAVATPQDEAGYDAVRVYRAPDSRLGAIEGKLEDIVTFGKFNYQYNGTRSIVYQVAYQDKFMQVIKLQYILAPRDPSLINDLHHTQTDALLLAAGTWTRDAHEQVWVFDDQEWSKSSSLWKAVQGTSWSDVVLPPSMRAKLHRDVHGFFDNRDIYRRARIPWKRGIIFHGVPGNGKSLTLSVMINELAKRDPPVPALYVKSLDACSGPKWSLQEIFKKARKTAPCLLVLEDLDSLVTNATRSYFLNEVDGLQSNDGILLIGSTNHLSRLDTSVTKRPSRFDRKYHFKLPSEAERLAYCRYWREKFASSSDNAGVELTEEMCEIVAKWTDGYSFAYLKELFVCSLLLHTRGEGDEEEEEDDGGEANGSKMPSDAKKDYPSVNGEKPARPADSSLNSNDSTDPKPKDSNREEPEQPKRLPVVPVPSHLKDNALLRVFRTQAQSLLEEMDHSTDKKAAPAGGAGDPPIKFRLPNLVDDGED